MKYIATILIVFAGLIAKAQTDSTSLVGTWELTKFIYNNKAGTTAANGFKRFKIVSPRHFTVSDIIPKANITKTSTFGTYTFLDGRYEEHILNVSDDSKKMMLSDLSFDVKFETADLISQIRGFNGIKSDESWKRVTLGDFTPHHD